MSKAKIVGGAVAIVGSGFMFAVVTIGGMEGKENHAYLDIGGVATICYGRTKGVRLGDYATDEECNEQIVDDVKLHWDAVDRAITTPMRPREQVAFTDLSFNIGVNAFANSTLVRYANSGNMPAACLELLKWVHDRQSKYWPDPVPGLVKRRHFFFKVCIGDGVIEQ